MPIYAYMCECTNKFEKFFTSISKAEPFLNSYKCEKCGNKAVRMASQLGAFFMNFGDAPKYSSNSDPEKV